MRSPLRLFNAWIDHQRLADRRRDVEWQLGVLFKQAVRLRPTLSDGGFDRIYLAHQADAENRVLASVRMNCLGRERAPDEPDLPRIALPGEHRIHREARAYRRLASLGVAPRLIARGEYFLVNHWLPWPRLSDVLRQQSERLWDALPVVLDAIRTMHDHGVVHMDLNCGNVLVSPDFSAAVIIDFEFAPLRSMNEFDQQRFDYLRLAHNLLKPRRGRDAAFQDPARFVELFAQHVPETGSGIPAEFRAAWFERIFENEVISAGFEEILGVRAWQWVSL